jgi:hypothetical protein
MSVDVKAALQSLRVVLNGGVLTAAERARLLAKYPEGA